MNAKDIQQFWSKKQRDFARLYRDIGVLEKSHFDPKRKQLNELENEILKLRKQIDAKRQEFQRVSQQAPSIWDSIRSRDSRLTSIRKSALKIKTRLEQRQKEYQDSLAHYNAMTKAVTHKIQHQPNPEFTPMFGKQKAVVQVDKNRRSLNDGLTL